MRFSNCGNCGKYKYMHQNGLCPTCSDHNLVRIRLDIIDDSLRTPDMLRTIADVIESVPAVKCDGTNSFDESTHDDLDLKENFCRLYEAEKKFYYDDYNGSKRHKLREAITEALQESKDQYS